MPILGEKKRARIVLQDNAIFEGFSFGAMRSVAGEVVFNTGMVGYPEALTDPSYKGQILTLTFPLVGNYGVPKHELLLPELERYFESTTIHVSGLIISDYSFQHSHWNAAQSLDAWMKQHDVPGVYGIDTRALTKKLREKGTMLGKIVVDKDISFFDPNAVNIVEEVSTTKPITYKAGTKKIIAVDCGIKHNIIRNFLDKNVTVIRVPWNYDFTQLDFDGVFISNGPGDPKQCTATIHNIQKALQEEKPIFGICLGSQILALAAGADTYKLKYGHRGQNQPCVEEPSKKCYITAQNHGFAVNTKTLPAGWEEWFVNANDGTNEGIRHKNKSLFATQFHPEGHCGPEDTQYTFDMFIKEL